MRTGDIFYMKKGKIHIIDRAKLLIRASSQFRRDYSNAWLGDLIKVRDWQVASAELEAILLTHPSIIIAAAVIIGKPVSEGTGEVPRAHVQLKHKPTPDHEAASYDVADEKLVTEAEVKQYVKERLTRYKCLDGGMCFVDKFPCTASGSVQKVKLGAMDAEEATELASGAGGNLDGVKAGDPSVRASLENERSEGEKFGEGMTNGRHIT